MALSPVRLRASMSVGSADTIAFTRSNSPALIASMKAALLEVVSGMHRFYRCSGPTLHGTAVRTAFATLTLQRRQRRSSSACRRRQARQDPVTSVRPSGLPSFIATILIAGRAAAQTTAAPPPPDQTAQPSQERPPLGASFPVEALGGAAGQRQPLPAPHRRRPTSSAIASTPAASAPARRPASARTAAAGRRRRIASATRTSPT